jgi:hypothetical protein
VSALPLDTDIAEKRPENEQSAANASGDLSSLLPDIVWRVPGASDLELRMAMRDAARDFCDRTNCWQEPISFPGDFPHCPGHWPLAMPQGAVALRIRENAAWISGRNAFRWRGFPGIHPLLDWQKWHAIPPFICGRAPMPIVAYAPGQDGETLPDDIVRRWGHAFVAGAVARLLATSDRPWFDKGRTAQQMAVVDFSAAVTDARAESEGLHQFGQPVGIGPLSTLPGTPFI